MAKTVKSSYLGTNLEKFLHATNIKTVVIAGLTTPHCVFTTSRMSGNLGFDTYLISDATATFGMMNDQNGNYDGLEIIHNTTLATLNEEFATILNTEQLLKKINEL
ncbi:hypothetical protein BSG1_08281 [Bacillus sp. SG-1]|nr:hypothetical protein BSG1_08281 [Bacillus sp. SG-1]